VGILFARVINRQYGWSGKEKRVRDFPFIIFHFSLRMGRPPVYLLMILRLVLETSPKALHGDAEGTIEQWQMKNEN
jgi:hypothetical protein